MPYLIHHHLSLFYIELKAHILPTEMGHHLQPVVRGPWLPGHSPQVNRADLLQNLITQGNQQYINWKTCISVQFSISLFRVGIIS